MAYELSKAEDEDIPLIPESSGLELAEEADLSDVIGFIDVDEAELEPEPEPAEELEPIEAEAIPESAAAQESSPEEENSGLAPLEEVDFELLLSSIDLSSLAQWESGPAGAEEADATRTARSDRGSPEAAPVPPELEGLQEADLLAEAELGGEPEESEGGEEPLDSLESAVSPDDEVAVPIGRYLGPCLVYRPVDTLSSFAANEELPVVGEAEDWCEPEFVDEDEEFAPPIEDGGIIEYRDGVFRLNADLAKAKSDGSEPFEGDSELRALVDSVLGGEPHSA